MGQEGQVSKARSESQGPSSDDGRGDWESQEPSHPRLRPHRHLPVVVLVENFAASATMLPSSPSSSLTSLRLQLCMLADDDDTECWNVRRNAKTYAVKRHITKCFNLQNFDPVFMKSICPSG